MSSSHEIVHTIAAVTGQPIGATKAVLALFEEGASLPFVARYRKERTGGMDEVTLKKILDEQNRLKDLDKRRQYIITAIRSQNKLTPHLEGRLHATTTLQDLEDLYLPFKIKRKTRAEKARQQGLSYIADAIWRQQPLPLNQLLKKHYHGPMKAQDALEGAKDILAERISELAWVRNRLRNSYLKHASILSKVIKKRESEADRFKDYFDYQEKLTRCPSHRYLAISRGENEGLLRVSLQLDVERILEPIRRKLIKSNVPTTAILSDILADAFKRLLAPSIENEVRKHYKQVADQSAIKLFGVNLRQLLLASPLGQKSILAIDPGFRTGCKVVALDGLGQLLEYGTIFPHAPQNDHKSAIQFIATLCKRYGISAIAVGNGTAGRETQEFLEKYRTDIVSVEIYLISESGASIYSASDLARKEFPDLDLTVRGAISIGRRLMDPLAELVKLDPKVIGVGQYQHDVDQRLLQNELEFVIQSCVNVVGVNVNTASPFLLSKISGLGVTLAERIVAFRNKHGPFRTREQLLHVEGLGPKAYQQCAGFLRIRDGKNLLDNTGVHPENYDMVQKMASSSHLELDQLIKHPDLKHLINPNDFVNDHFGLPTIHDILAELEKPGLDPRGLAEPTQFESNVRSIEDLRLNMLLNGTVTNITHFGAFVDMGIKENGLIHKSQLGKFVSDPAEILRINQHIKVQVLDIEVSRKRIQLKLMPD